MTTDGEHDFVIRLQSDLCVVVLLFDDDDVQFSSPLFCITFSQIRGVEIGIVVLVLMVWAGAIGLFFNRWGKIRMLLPYQPDYKQDQLKVPGAAACPPGQCNGHQHQVTLFIFIMAANFLNMPKKKIWTETRNIRFPREENFLEGKSNLLPIINLLQNSAVLFLFSLSFSFFVENFTKTKNFSHFHTSFFFRRTLFSCYTIYFNILWVFSFTCQVQTDPILLL